MDKEDTVYIEIYSEILLIHKKEWSNAIHSKMDRPRDYHTNWSKSARKRQMSWYCLNVESGRKKKRKDTGELIHKTEVDQETQRPKLWIPKGKDKGRNKLEVWYY